MMKTNFERIIISYGSESGNAERLARQFCELPFLSSVKLELVTLNNLVINDLSTKDLLLVITSTFGDGEPPGNADDFALQLASLNTLAPFQYAIFALGDVAYTNFCQFGQQLDAQLHDKGAIRAINRVDADLDYRTFFTQWVDTVNAVVAGDDTIGHQLMLRVEPYSETKPHQAKIINVTRLNSSSAGVYKIDLDIDGSGMNYRAGDLLYVVPNHKSELLQDITDWFGDEQTSQQLQGKELRLLSKSLLRTLANKSNNANLKEKLKIRNKKALADYLYGRDVLDVLQDCGEVGYITLSELCDALSEQTARAYSIASSDQNSDGKSASKVSLCVRDIAYEHENRMHFGTMSNWLSRCEPGDIVDIFTRSNKEFHLADEIDTPVIMIGAGTGIAPYVGFLQQLERQQKAQTELQIKSETLLIFGERYSKKDFLYKSELEHWLSEGVLSQLVTVFSRDQEQKRYVQHAIIEQGALVWSLLQRDATLYLCGSKDNLAKAIDNALIEVAQQHGKLSFDQAQSYINQLTDTGHYRRDLY